MKTYTSILRYAGFIAAGMVLLMVPVYFLFGNTLQASVATQSSSSSDPILTGIPAVPVCGNGKMEAQEQCDDGNMASGDGCSMDCLVEPGFSCMGQPSRCKQIAGVCGNGSIDAREQCDDGNANNADGCSAQCTLEPGFVCEGNPSACISTSSFSSSQEASASSVDSSAANSSDAAASSESPVSSQASASSLAPAAATQNASSETLSSLAASASTSSKHAAKIYQHRRAYHITDPAAAAAAASAGQKGDY